MSKNIILLSDGTGNSASNLFKSNVWRLYQALDLTTEDPGDPGQPKQLAYHDDGVGTASFKPLALIGGAFGFGLKRNVLDLYCFLSRHYKPGRDDSIYAFGFSRGAFTIRVLTGLILSQGLVQSVTDKAGEKRPVTESERRRLAAAAYRAFRDEHYKRVWLALVRPLRNGIYLVTNKLLRRKIYKKTDTEKVKEIEFLGLWDTVAAYGLPVDELTRAWNFIFPLAFPDRDLDERVNRACHALALDDERLSFHPELWNEKGKTEKGETKACTLDKDGQLTIKHIADERITQVWFAGMHSNVGGSYPDDGMSLVPFSWIMDQAAPPPKEPAALPPKEPNEDSKELKPVAGNEPKKDRVGLWIDEGERRKIKAAANPNGKMYDSRKGTGGFYRYRPRKLSELTQDTMESDNEVVVELPKIHESVFKRIKNGTDGYAPIGLPDKYAVVKDNGTIVLLPPAVKARGTESIEAKEDAETRARQQEQVWSRVWLKRQVYFLSIVLASLLVSLPWWHPRWQVLNSLNQLAINFGLRTVIGAIGKLLPDMVSPWIKAYQDQPGLFCLLAVLYGATIGVGDWLQRRIFDAMRIRWNAVFPKPGAPQVGVEPGGLLYRLYRIRTRDVVRKVIFWWKRKFVPVVLLLALLVLAYYFVHRGLYQFENSAGLICRPSNSELKSELEAGKFPNKTLCWPTGVKAEKDRRYQIMLTLPEGQVWQDSALPTSLQGFSADKLQSRLSRLVLYVVQPLRRQPDELWFQPMAKIGSRGRDEYPLRPAAGVPTNLTGRTLNVEIKARNAGELFLFVNDFVSPIPAYQPTYDNNWGTATVTIKPLDCEGESLAFFK